MQFSCFDWFNKAQKIQFTIDINREVAKFAYEKRET